MMKKQDRIFQQTYKIDESTNLYMIEIALDRYSDIFNEWDPSPFKRREINPHLEHYLVISSDEIPLQYQIELYMEVPKGMRNEQVEEEVRNGIKNHFTFRIYLAKKIFRKNNSNTLYFVLMASFLLGLTTIWEITPDKVLSSIVKQGLLIGGWVFLWEAVSLFFFTNRELYDRYRTYKRLRNSLVIFREVEQP